MEEVSEPSSYSESFHWLWKHLSPPEADPVGDPVAFHMPNTAAAFSAAWPLLEIGSNGVMPGVGGGVGWRDDPCIQRIVFVLQAASAVVCPELQSPQS